MATLANSTSENGRAPATESGARRLLVAKRISKSYGVVQALKDVDIEIHRGEIHAIVGENGAGKSTLMKIFAGEERPTAGEIRIEDRLAILTNPNEARAHGIAIVHQHFQLVDTLTVAENISLNQLPIRSLSFVRLLDRDRLVRTGAERLAPFGLSNKVGFLVRELTVAERQIVEISRALGQKAELLILDEPTSALSAHEIEILFDHVRRLRDSGVAVVLIAHSIDEVFSISDKITVLRDGRCLGTFAANTLDPTSLVSMIIGRELAKGYPKAAVSIAGELLRASLGAGERQQITARRGEIIGVPTYVGSAVRNVIAVLSGERRGARRSVLIRGRPAGHLGIRGRIKNGICLVPGDATAESLIPKMTIEENLLLPNLPRLTKYGFMSKRRGRSFVQNVIQMLDIRPKDPSTPVDRLSGGNRQKVAIGKWLMAGTEVLLMDDPTRGIDVGAKVEIYRVIGDLVASGKAVILASSDLDELLGLADRIVVIRGGRVMQSFDERPFEKAAVLARTTVSDRVRVDNIDRSP